MDLEALPPLDVSVRAIIIITSVRVVAVEIMPIEIVPVEIPPLLVWVLLMMVVMVPWHVPPWMHAVVKPASVAGRPAANEVLNRILALELLS